MAACESIKKFKEVNKIAPKRMIIYREGVSESQLDLMLSTEVTLMKEAIDKEFPGIQIKVQRLKQKGLCAPAMAESIKLKLLAQIPVRVAVSSVIRQAVDKEKAKGCEVIVSGKMNQQRAKSMKFKKGYMISAGNPKNDYIEEGIRHVSLKQGVMGVKVKIMKEYDPKNPQCASVPLPDHVEFYDVKKESEANREKITNKAIDSV